MYSNFLLLERLLSELLCKNMDTHTQTHTHTLRDSDEYSIVAFCKNVTILHLLKKSSAFKYMK